MNRYGNKKNFILALMMHFFIEGCSFSGLQPAPEDFKRWIGPNDAKKALLECGAPDPFSMGYQLFNQKFKLTHAEIADVENCMRASGFSLKVTNSYSNYECNFNQTLPACQPNAIAPKRDLGKRLNSPYCTHMRGLPNNYKLENYPICLP